MTARTKVETLTDSLTAEIIWALNFVSEDATTVAWFVVDTIGPLSSRDVIKRAAEAAARVLAEEASK